MRDLFACFVEHTALSAFSKRSLPQALPPSAGSQESVWSPSVGRRSHGLPAERCYEGKDKPRLTDEGVAV